MPFTPASLRIRPRDPAPLGHRDPDDRLGFTDKDEAVDLLHDLLPELRDLHDRLFAERRWSLLVILQAMDAAGKDGVIKHVFGGGFNQQSCHVTAFSAPAGAEVTHTFLWRCVKALPGRGEIGVFNRSYYEELLVPRIHPAYLGAQRLPAECFAGDLTAPGGGHPGTRNAKPANRNPKRSPVPSDSFWRARMDDINALERHLQRNGTRVVKCFLHLSRGEQKKRFLSRIEDPTRNWKFQAGDGRDRRDWDRYHALYAELIGATSTPWAPWYVVPADYKYVARLAVAKILRHELGALDPQFPKLDAAGRRALAAAKRALLRE